MAQSPMNIAGFPDILDPRFREVTDGEYSLEEDFIPKFYNQETPTQYTERGSSLTPMGLFSEFGGLLAYDAPDPGYSWTSYAKEYAKAIAVERLLVEYDQFNVIEGRFKLLARSARQTRQIEASNSFVNAFIVDPGYTNSEGVALCSDSHTCPRAGVSTAIGFDNNTTAAFSATALKAAWVQMLKFRDNAGQPIDGMTADTVLGPVDLIPLAEEIFTTDKGLDGTDSLMVKNILQGKYRFQPWIRLNNTQNWFLINNSMMKENLFWFDKVKPEFARVEDFDTIVAKYRGYYVSHRARADWRFCLGANVS